MSAVDNARAWVRKLRAAAPTAWRQDQIFRYALLLGIVASAVILLSVANRSRSIEPYRPPPYGR